jgi:catechol 2,3-dioxygenase-like lactoylglutathione lyase family enzyme
MHVLQLDHVQISMPPDRELEARLFYDKLLGIPEVRKPPHLASRGGCWFERGTLKLHLGVEKTFSPARKAHPAFLVDDLAALIELLRQNGYESREDQPLDGYMRVYVDDPFGNRIELMQRNE